MRTRAWHALHALDKNSVKYLLPSKRRDVFVLTSIQPQVAYFTVHTSGNGGGGISVVPSLSHPGRMAV